MKVLKFGGTSVGSAQRIKDVAKLINERGRNLIVLSAMSGTTNSLVEIGDYLYKKNIDGAKETINILEAKYIKTIDELYSTKEYKEKATEAIKACFNYIRSFSKDIFTMFEEREILAQGELMSTALLNFYLQETGVNSVLLPALDFMRTDKNAEADTQYIREKLTALMQKHPEADLFLTQGYICRNAYGEIDNLQRGGSDLTASIIGAVLDAEEIEIWTDIDGMHNNDPRFVEGTKPVKELHFEEAAELAYFGAKILHPTCVLPAKLNNIPVRLLNTMQPDAPGTLIHNTSESRRIKAVAAKDNITAIKIKSGRMLLAYGFLRKVFEIFETYKTSIDMIATSEVGVSVTIDDERNLQSIVDDLKKFGTVTVDRDMVIICVVGDLEWQNRGFEAKALDALRDIPVRMISYGGSNYNISFLVRKEDKVAALNSLSQHLFND
ncbi:MAG: aspartate kinase [Bacteroidales bacterium]|nr:aspartate kinase [Bacteroidales bacterium]MBD5235683.1 aspartate kinase [Barnesiella sp.]MBD5248340.1 aspartate kinase [Barnesiella sp.]